jgi:hypothetical protein
MAGLLLLLCVVAVGVALGIVYLLYGPAPAKPLGAVPRASMTLIPPPQHAPVAVYNPEAVFALEHTSAIADASRAFATLTPAMPVPVMTTPPLPRMPAPTPEPLPPVPSTRALPPPTPSFMRGRATSPQPLPRARSARGTDSPRPMPATPRAAQQPSAPHDSFVELDPALLADETIAS